MRVDEHTIELAGSPVFLRRAPGPNPLPLYLHGLPTSSDDWTAVLERTGGIAVDLPGFGRTGKGGQLDISPGGHAAFLGELLDHLRVPRVTVVAHDWGAAGAVVLAARRPERISRLVLINPVAPEPSADGRRLSRAWRTPGVGEIAVGAITRRGLKRMLHRAGSPEAWPQARVEEVWDQFDQGTQRAVLRLYRIGAGEIARSAGQVRAPATIVHGTGDPWCLPAAIAAYHELLPDAERRELAEGRHWPWLEQASAAELIAELACR